MTDVKKSLDARLNKIEGQIRGIRKMLDEDRDCEEILLQISAVNAALTNTARIILESHLEHCVVEAIRRGDETDTIASLKKVITQFSKLK